MFSKYLILIICFCVSGITYAQTEKNDSIASCSECDSLYNRICPPHDPPIFGHPQRLPQFPGGDKKLFNFIMNNLQLPNDMDIQGRVTVRFIVTEKGKIICPKIIRSLDPACDKEALRIIQLMPDWEPASNNEKPVSFCYTLPIIFKLYN